MSVLRLILAIVPSLGLIAPSAAQQAPPPPNAGAPIAIADYSGVAPAIERYTRDVLLEDVWKRPALSRRDRSIVTLAAVVTRGQLREVTFHVGFALDNGVKAAEISELLTHLAFYAGWGNATASAQIAKDVFSARGITPDQLPKASPDLLPLNEAAEADREKRNQDSFGAVAPQLLSDTTAHLFRDLWRRPDLAPRDRSLVTVSALVASGQVAQIPYHLNRAMDAGLTQAQASETLSHLGYYAGWPSVFSALPAAKSVFEARSK